MTFRSGFLIASALLAGVAARAGVVINELHYHPPSHDPRDEFVELLNTGSDTVNLRGWQFTAGVRFTFTNDAVLAPGEFWVVAADPARLQGQHTGLTRVSGGWDGQLSHTGEAVELRSPTGVIVQRVEYADEGDWALRARGPVDFGHRGLVWEAAHDGGGASLELCQPRLPNTSGQNWAASLVSSGTPGLANSAAATNLPPLLTDVGHAPAVPRSADLVTVRARVTDEAGPPAAVTLLWRRDGDAEFATLPMRDDGAGGDALANDGLFAAAIPAQTNLTVVEFFIEAADVAGLTRTWPAPVREDDGLRQTANALFAVDNTPDTAGFPQLRLAVKVADLAVLRQINRNFPAAPFPGFDQTRSHAQMNGTFVATEAGRTEVRYRAGVRNRGNGSRVQPPQSFRVNLPADRRWNEVVALNLNTQNPDLQILGNALFRAAGLPAGQARPVQLRVNGLNHALPGAPTFGIIAANEVLDADFADRQFPNDAGGNLYRGQRLDGPGGSTHANLDYRGPDADAYRPLYFKRTNGAEDDWSDLIELTRVLTETPETNFVAEARRVADVEQWARWFALHTLLDNRETSPVNGSGDDYFLYRGVADPRFRLLPYDLDTILGLGSPAGSATNTLWPMLSGRVPTFERVLTNAEFAPLYLGELRRLTGRLFDVFQLEERLLPGVLADPRREAIQDFVFRRIEHVRAQIPTSLTVTSDLPVINALPTAAGPEAGLHGTAFAGATRRVLVNGRPAPWSSMQGRWTNAAAALRPGINRILVEAQSVSNITFAHAHYDVVWLPPGAGTDVGGALAGEVTWGAAGSPYRVHGTVTVPAGTRLTIEPGTTVFFAAGAGLDVRGQLVAAGTPTNRIRFTRPPGAASPTNSWAGFAFRDTTASNRLAHVDVEFAGSSGRSIQTVNAALELEDCSFAGTTRTFIETSNSSLYVTG
ncbi:MAG: CotH kinase family protein, partial [Limisphaerales bacterium]